MALSLGIRMDETDPREEEALMHVLAACKEFGVPAASVRPRPQR